MTLVDVIAEEQRVDAPIVIVPIIGPDGGEPPRRGPRRRPGRWFSDTGWRHVVALVALVFALFPVWWVICGAFSTEGLASQQVVPEQLVAQQLQDADDGTWPPTVLAVVRQLHDRRRRDGAEHGVPLRAGRLRVLPPAVQGPARRPARPAPDPDVPERAGRGGHLPVHGGGEGRVPGDRRRLDLGPDPRVPRRRPRREHLADEGVLRHAADRARRVGQGGRRHAQPGVLQDHPAAGRARAGRDRAPVVHPHPGRVPPRRHPARRRTRTRRRWPSACRGTSWPATTAGGGRSPPAR